MGKLKQYKIIIEEQMKRIIVLLLFGMLMLGACSSSGTSESPYLWEIVQSPITGRYYEVYSSDYGDSCAMSEVTKWEYDEYLLIKEKRK